MSFDGAKLRRIIEHNKSFYGIVCANSPFVDPCQRIARFMIFLYFQSKKTGLWIKMITFAT